LTLFNPIVEKIKEKNIMINSIQSTNNNYSQQSFGAFCTKNKETLACVKEVIGEEVLPLKDFFKKGDCVIDLNGFTTIGQFFTKKQIQKYLKTNPDTYITKKDIVDLTCRHTYTRERIPEILNNILANKANISLEQLKEPLANLRLARYEFNIVKNKTMQELGL
jgi:uncharacterized protein YneF (UPF0154 family)